MKAIKMIGLAALTALMVMAFVGAASAMAESTTLCSNDPIPSDEKTPCEEITHVHESSVGNAKLLTSIGTTECTALFLGDVKSTGSPLVISGEFTYSECKLGGAECTAKEENGPAEIKVLREGHETSKVTGEGLVHLVCGKTIDCSYTGTGLVGTGKGPLLSAESNPNGEVKISEASTTKEAGGFLCPKTAKLDITTTPLTATYISAVPLSYCVETRHSSGVFINNTCTTPATTAHTGTFTLVYAWAGWGTVGDLRCYDTLSTAGLYTTYRSSGLGCDGDYMTRTKLYENGKIITEE